MEISRNGYLRIFFPLQFDEKRGGITYFIVIENLTTEGLGLVLHYIGLLSERSEFHFGVKFGAAVTLQGSTCTCEIV